MQGRDSNPQNTTRMEWSHFFPFLLGKISTFTISRVGYWGRGLIPRDPEIRSDLMEVLRPGNRAEPVAPPQ